MIACSRRSPGTSRAGSPASASARRRRCPTHGLAAQILAELGPRTIRVLSDAAEDERGFGLEGFGFRVAGREPLGVRLA